MENSPRFSLTANRFDLSTYWGRLKYFVEITDPRTLLYSNETITESKKVLDGFRSTGLVCGSDSDMWKHRRIVETSIHPISGELIPAPFRVSAIAPVNIPIVRACINELKSCCLMINFYSFRYLRC